MKKIYFVMSFLVLSLVCFNAMAQKSVLFVGGASPIDSADMHIADSITAWGYTVTYEEDGNFKDTYLDASFFTPYDAIILSESISSSNGQPLQDVDYIIPCVNLEGYTVREGKWSWVPWEEGVNELYWYTNKTPDIDGLSMIVTDNKHYITEEYNMDEEIVWSTEVVETIGEQVSYDLSANITGSVALAKSKSAAANGKFVLTAIPEGTMVPGSLADVATKRMVIFATHKNSLAPAAATDGFRNIMKRSLEWVLGAESSVNVQNLESGFSGVKLLTNPVRDLGTISFNLSDAGNVSFSVVNLIGQQTLLRTNEFYSAGNNEITFSTNKLNAGIYVYQLRINNDVYSGKMHVQK